MGENLAVEGRAAVRTPMQRSDEDNGGFSPAPPDRLPAAVPDGEHGPPAVNVSAQRRDPDSLLNWFERLIRRREETPELGFGEWSELEHDDSSVFAHACRWDDSTVVALHNLSPEPSRLAIPLDVDDAVAYDDLLDGGRSDLAEPCLRLTLDGYGCKWYRIHRKDQRVTP